MFNKNPSESFISNFLVAKKFFRRLIFAFFAVSTAANAQSDSLKAGFVIVNGREDCKIFTNDISRTINWTGPCLDGYADGKGIAQISKDNLKIIVEGAYRQGKLNGRASLSSSDGGKYVGEFKNGVPHGNGTFDYWHGASYSGEYRDGKQEGKGTFTASDGSKYTGEFKNGKYEGKGTFTASDGSKYTGEFKNGKYHGRGSLVQANGRELIGVWDENKLVKDEIEERERENKEREREKCLNEGAVGVCYRMENGIISNRCGGKLRSDIDCYYTDYDVVKFDLDIRNNLKRQIADILIQCDQLAKSGTILKREQHTEYDIWGAKQTKSISIKFNRHSQTASGKCAVISWTEISEPVVAQVFDTDSRIYWRNDTEFMFTRNDNRLSTCFYQSVFHPEVECPKNTWLTDEPKCGNMVWLHNARINNKDKLLFATNFGTAEPSASCKQLLKSLGPLK